MSIGGGFHFRLSSSGTDPIDANRLPYGGTWEGLVGVVGGIPTNRTKQGSTISAYGTSGSPGSPSTITDALAAASAAGGDRYVELGAGDFYLSSDIAFDESNVTLVGQVDANGVPTTIIHGASVVFEAGGGGWAVDDSTKFTNVNISSGHTRGSSTLTLAGTPTGLTTGRLMIISAPANSTILGGGGLKWHGTNPWTQVVKVTAVNGTAVTFTPPINASYLSGTCKVSYRAASMQMSRSGVENIKFVDNGGAFVIWRGTDECWAKNVVTFSIPMGQVHLYPYITYRTEIRHCDVSHMEDTGSSTYCIQPIHSSSMLVEDNYLHDCPNVMPTTPWSGSVFAYNYINDLPYSTATFLSQIVYAHGCTSHFNLFEGNWFAASYNDRTADGEFSHSRDQTYLRNRMRGYDATGPKSDNTSALSLMLQHDNYTLSGNVLGENGVQTEYHFTFTAAGDNFRASAILNIHTTCDATLDLFGNYNTVNDAVASGEALTAGQAIPTSYFRSSKPSYFSSLPWPWVDPSNFTQSNTVTNLPAGYRATNGVDP